jgi:hypothetical protein
VYRIDTADNVAVMPVPDPIGPAPGYYRKATDAVRGTVVSSDWLNAVQEEIVSVILAAAIGLDKTDQSQLYQAIAAHILATPAIAGLISHATDTGAVTTTHRRAVAASWNSQASGADSFVGGSISCQATGDVSGALGASNIPIAGDKSVALGTEGGQIDATAQLAALLASNAGQIAGQRALLAAVSTSAPIHADARDVAGIASASLQLGQHAQQATLLATDGCRLGLNAASDRAAAIASYRADVDAANALVAACFGVAFGDVDNEGPGCAILASGGTAADPTRIESTGLYSLIAACQDCEIDDCDRGAIIASQSVELDTTGGSCVALACQEGTISGAATQSALISCGSDGANAPDMQGNGSSAVAVRGQVAIQSNDTVVLASLFDGAGVIVNEANAVVGGKDADLYWKIESETGDVFFGSHLYAGWTASGGPNPPAVVGAKGGNVALANLLTTLDTMGLIDDQTT